jgi:heme/copper-type cytochrome/quinol oxidase subunit 4
MVLEGGSRMVASAIAVIRYCVIGIGIALAYYLYFTWSDARPALEVVLLTCVAFNGLISFVSHVIFHKADAARLGLESSSPGYQYEVGFANLAMGLSAVAAYAFQWGISAYIVLVLCYSLYIIQAVVFHFWRFIKRERSDAGYLWGSVIFTAIYVANMLFFALAAITQERLAPLS